MTLRYDGHRRPVITTIKRVSKPGLRKYMRATEIPHIRTGLGVMILTTSKGVMTDRQCRENNVGGEAPLYGLVVKGATKLSRHR